MAGEPRVHPGHQIDCGLDPFAVGLTGVEFVGTEVFIDVPHTAAGAVGDTAQHWRTAVTQADGGQPPFGYEFVALSNLGLETFHHDRARFPFDFKAQTKHARAPRLELLLFQEATRCFGSAQQFVQQTAELSDARLARAFENLLQSINHIDSPWHADAR